MNLKLIGERIKYLRTYKIYLSQEDFSVKLGYDRTYMSRVESGRQNITIETLIKISEGLEISLKDFFDFEVENEEA
mgnify:CR=1 FL=1